MQYPTRLLVSAAVALTFSAAHAASIDLGDASQFSVLTFGNFSGYRGDTSSLLAAGGDVSLSSWKVNAFNKPGYSGYSLIVGGGFTGLNGNVVGNSFIGTNSSTTAFGLGSSPAINGGSSPLNFSTLQSQLQVTSATTKAAVDTGTVDYAGGSTLLYGTDSDVEVFSIDGSKLSADSSLASVSGIKSNATVILNVSGGNVSMSNFGIDIANKSKDINLLFNFYDATSLSFSGLAIEGAVLAPYAAVTGTDGHIGGTFVANSFASGPAGNFEFHELNFNPVDVPSVVPEPEQWVMMMAGLMVLPWMARRRRTALVKPRPSH